MAARPPRWSDAERLLRQTRAMPQFAKDVDFMQQEATMWAGRGNSQKALDAMKQALQAAPNNPNLVRNYLNLLLQSKNYPQVLAETDQLLQGANGKIWWVYELRGQARARRGDRPAAMNEFLTALNLAVEARNDDVSLQLVRDIANEVGADEALKVVLPKIQDIRWKLTAALLYHNKGDTEQALKLADEAMAGVSGHSPADQASVYRTAGSIYITAKPDPRVSQAADAYKKLLVLSPDDLNALNNLAYLYSDLIVPRQPQTALEYSSKAFGLLTGRNQFDPLVYDTHGWVLVQSGQVAEGIEILQQVLLRQAIPEAHYHVAEAYLKKGYPEEAERHLNAVSDLLKANEEKKQPVDPTLRAKIDDALLRTTRQIEAKKQAGT
jgi:tetratricopeptide (TPR) repeat protein